MKKVYFLFSFLFLSFIAKAQFSFENKNSRLTDSNVHSGCPVAVADWNFDGLDDIIKLDDGTICSVELQKTNQQFQKVYLGDFGGGSGWAWAMAVADFDHNGYLDVVAAGTSISAKVLFSNGMTTGTQISLPNSNFFAQNITCADFNNDGWVDIFICDDNAESHIYLNNAGVFTESLTTINFDVTNTDDSGNYGSSWVDFDNDGDLDLYIAKCRQSVSSPTDGRRINVMFVNDGNGNFTENAAAYNLNIGWQSWTASFGDIDNDGDLDLLVTNHDHESQIWENDGTGVYTDITAASGFDITDITPIQSVLEDFDNDGFVDILATGSNSRFYKNNGNKTFTKVEGLFNSNKMESFAIGDLNHDGKIDLYSSYAGIYTNPSSIDDVIWFNTAKDDNHFLTVQLIGTVSNHSAIGSRVTIYGSWGIQIREVLSGDGYGRTNSAMLHFGLGTAGVIDSMVVRFPSGITQTIINPEVDQFVKIIENTCVSPQASVVYTRNENIICSGDTETFTATAGFNYLWTDLSTNSTLDIISGGEFNAIITETGNLCETITPTVEIIENPDQTPVLKLSGAPEFCNGNSLTLDGNNDVISYLWSDGSTTKSITVNQSGTYYLTVSGYCATFNSDTVNVTVHMIPDPVTSNVSITGPASATLTATGTDILWYDDPAAVVPVGSGSSWNTPVLSTNATFWAENNETYNSGDSLIGRNDGATGSYSANSTNGQVYFTVHDNCVLNSVKVFTDVPGIRRFELRNPGGAVLQFIDVNIVPDSQVVTLDFAIAPGDYVLTTNSTVNQQIPNHNASGPRFHRHSGNSVYPYEYTDVLSITGNNLNQQYYYYFYEWQVHKKGLTCNSDRIQVDVTVTVGLQELAAEGIEIYPNPANEFLNVRQPKNEEWVVTLFDATGKIVSTQVLNEMNSKIDLEGVVPGFYLINFRNSEKNVSGRIIKQ